MVIGDPGSLEPVPQHAAVELSLEHDNVTIQLQLTMEMNVLEFRQKKSAVLDSPFVQVE